MSRRRGPEGRCPALLAVLPAAVASALAACGGEDAPAAETPAYAAALEEGTPPGTALRFTEIAAEAGLDMVHENGAFGEKWMPETVGSGVAFVDYDLDGAPDVFLVNGDWWPGHGKDGPRPTARLYRNLGDGTFRDVTRAAGVAVPTYGMGVAVGDYDGDGDPDLFVSAVGPNRLFRNDGGRFTEVARDAGVVGGDESWTTSSAWLDADRDGRLDLFACNYVRWTPETDLFTTMDGTNKSYATPQQYGGDSCRFHHNDGGGTFSDRTEAVGVLNDDGKALGVAVADFEEDGWPDIVVANDTQRNFLYRNDGDGTFTDVAVRAGVAFDEAGRARAGMGVAVADLTADGSWAIAIGNFSHEPVALFTRIGEDLFQDRAGAARLTRPTLLPLTFGVEFADVDLDGRSDLLAVNGHIEPSVGTVQQDVTFEQPPQLFLGHDEGTFVEVSGSVGEDFAAPMVGRGLATADVDDDGDLDVLVSVNAGAPRLFRNELPPGAAWLKVGLDGAAPNTDAYGALVTVWSGGRAQRRYVASGSSYLSASITDPLVFGLGGDAAADSIVVRWPRGGSTTVTGPLATGETYRIEERR